MVTNNQVASFLPGYTTPFVDNQNRITPVWQNALARFPTNITVSGNYNLQINLTGNSTVTFPTSGTIPTLTSLTWDKIHP